MSQNLQNFVKFQKFQLENLVDFEKCCQTHIYLQKSEPIQPKTSNILPKICRSAVVSPTGATRRRRDAPGGAAYDAGPCSGGLSLAAFSLAVWRSALRHRTFGAFRIFSLLTVCSSLVLVPPCPSSSYLRNVRCSKIVRS